jgi:hypothetical protein
VYRLARGARLGGWRCLLKFLGWNADTRSVFDCNKWLWLLLHSLMLTYRSAGLELSRNIHLPELARNSSHNGNIEFVGLDQHILRAETPSCGMCSFNTACKCSSHINPYPRKVPYSSYTLRASFAFSFPSGCFPRKLRLMKCGRRSTILDGEIKVSPAWSGSLPVSLSCLELMHQVNLMTANYRDCVKLTLRQHTWPRSCKMHLTHFLASCYGPLSSMAG